ncbi:MAG: DHA2 family efflux MFS transporter permease subunit [Stackebrandtia sp.]
MTKPDTPRLLPLAIVMLLGAMMAMFDATIVNVGIETLTVEFDASLPLIEWVATGYLLSFAATVPVSGWLSDRFGGRRVWLIGLATFVLASVGAALAPTAAVLVAVRIVQGIGAGLLEPTLLTILGRVAGPAQAGRLAGLVGAVTALGPVFGPVLGGLILAVLDWQWMFLVNIPIGIVAFVLSFRMVPRNTAATSKATLDIRGLAMLSPGFGLLVYALSMAASHGFSSIRVLSLLAAGIVLIAAYVRHALRTTRPALVDVRLFAHRGFTVSVIGFFGVGSMLFATLYLLPLYYQQDRGLDPFTAGLLLAPVGAGAVISMQIGGRLSDRTGARPLVTSGAAIAGVAALVLLLIAPYAAVGVLAALSGVIGWGFGLIGSASFATVYRSVPTASVPSATIAMYMLNQIGAAVGIAVVTVIIQSLNHGTQHMALWWVIGMAVAVFAVGLLHPPVRDKQRATESAVAEAV